MAPRRQLQSVQDSEQEIPAEIFFEARGYAVVPDVSKGNEWRYSGALRFEADGEYEWLNRESALWQGVFDAKTGRASYIAFVAADNSRSQAKKRPTGPPLRSRASCSRPSLP